MPPPKKLKEQDRAKLDGIVQKMQANKESDADIQFVVEDFKNKYGVEEVETVKKKEPASPVGGTPSQAGGVSNPSSPTSESISVSESVSVPESPVPQNGKPFWVQPIADNSLMPKGFGAPVPKEEPSSQEPFRRLFQPAKGIIERGFDEHRKLMQNPQYAGRVEATNRIKELAVNPSIEQGLIIDADKEIDSKIQNAQKQLGGYLSQTAAALQQGFDPSKIIQDPNAYPEIIEDINNVYNTAIRSKQIITPIYNTAAGGAGSIQSSKDYIEETPASLALTKTRDLLLQNVKIARDNAIISANPNATSLMIGNIILESENPILASQQKVSPNISVNNFLAEKLGLNAKVTDLARRVELGDKSAIDEGRKVLQQEADLVYKYPEQRKSQLRQMVIENMGNNRDSRVALDDYPDLRKAALPQWKQLLKAPPNAKDIPLIQQAIDDLQLGEDFWGFTKSGYRDEIDEYQGQGIVNKFLDGFADPFTEAGKSIRNVFRSDKAILEQKDAEQVSTAKYTPSKFNLKQSDYIMDTDAKSPTYGQLVHNENAGKYNWTPQTVLNAGSYGAGMILGQLTAGEVAGLAAKPITGAIAAIETDVAGFAGSRAVAGEVATPIAQSIANDIKIFVPAYAMSYDQNYKKSFDYFGAGEGASWKRGTYSFLSSLSESVSEKIGNPYEQLGSVVRGTSAASRIASNMANLSRRQMANMDKSAWQAFFKPAYEGAFAGLKNVTGETAEELVNNATEFSVATVMGAEGVEQRDLASELNDTFKQTMAQMSFLGVMSGAKGAANSYSNSSLTKRALFDIGANPAQYRDYLTKQLADEQLSQDEYNEKVRLVNTAESAKSTWNNIKHLPKAKGQQDVALSETGGAFVQARANELALAKDNKVEKEKGAQSSDAVIQANDRLIKQWQEVQRNLLDEDVHFDEAGNPALQAVSMEGVVESHVKDINDIPEALRAQATKTPDGYVVFLPTDESASAKETKALADLAAWRTEANELIKRTYQDNPDPMGGWKEYADAKKQYQVLTEKALQAQAPEATENEEVVVAEESVVAPENENQLAANVEPIEQDVANEELAQKLRGIRNDDFMRQYFNEQDVAAYEAADDFGKVELIKAKKEQLLNPAVAQEESVTAAVVEETTEVEEAVIAEPILPKEGDTVEIAPAITSGSPRTMVFEGGQWKQKVGNATTRVGFNSQTLAQNEFDKKNASNPTQKNEEAVAVEIPPTSEEVVQATPTATSDISPRVSGEGGNEQLSDGTTNITAPAIEPLPTNTGEAERQVLETTASGNDNSDRQDNAASPTTISVNETENNKGANASQPENVGADNISTEGTSQPAQEPNQDSGATGEAAPPSVSPPAEPPAPPTLVPRDENQEERDIEDILSRTLDRNNFPTVLGENPEATQLAAGTQSAGQGREVGGDYIQAFNDDLKSISLQTAGALRERLGEGWQDKTLAYLEKYPNRGNLAQVIGVLNILSTDVFNQLNATTNPTKISELEDKQRRIDKLALARAREGSQSLRQRQLYAQFAKGAPIVDLMAQTILAPEQLALLEAINEAVVEPATDAEVNAVPDAPAESTPKEKESKKKQAKEKKDKKAKDAKRKPDTQARKDLIAKGAAASEQENEAGGKDKKSFKELLDAVKERLNKLDC